LFNIFTWKCVLKPQHLRCGRFRRRTRRKFCRSQLTIPRWNWIFMLHLSSWKCIWWIELSPISFNILHLYHISNVTTLGVSSIVCHHFYVIFHKTKILLWNYWSYLSKIWLMLSLNYPTLKLCSKDLPFISCLNCF
jgi:hypothetical protein